MPFDHCRLLSSYSSAEFARPIWSGFGPGAWVSAPAFAAPHWHSWAPARGRSSLPRFLDDAASAKLLRAARADPDPFARLAIELLARTGLRKGELMALTIGAVVQIGSAYWLRVPVGKLHNDRYIPLHPQLKTLLDDWLADRPAGLRSDLIFLDWGRPIPPARVDRALTRIAAAAGIAKVTAHQLRHTLAPQVGFSRAIRSTSARTGSATGGRPGCRRG